MCCVNTHKNRNCLCSKQGSGINFEPRWLNGGGDGCEGAPSHSLLCSALTRLNHRFVFAYTVDEEIKDKSSCSFFCTVDLFTG